MFIYAQPGTLKSAEVGQTTDSTFFCLTVNGFSKCLHKMEVCIAQCIALESNPIFPEVVDFYWFGNACN